LGRAALRYLLCALALALVAPGAAGATTYTVNTTADPGFRDIPTCSGVPDDCSLRDAVDRANDADDVDTIAVPAGHYTLEHGQIGVFREATIQGAGARTTIVDAAGSDHVFDVSSPDNVQFPVISFRDITATGANSHAFRTFTGLDLLRVTVKGNGGGVESPFTEVETFGDIRIVDSTISGNQAAVSEGAGIASFTGSLTVIDSTITGNTATGETGTGFGGGILHDTSGGPLAIFNSTIAGNTAQGTNSSGGNISVAGTANAATLKNTIVSGGTADSTANCDGTLTSLGHNLISDGSQCGFDASKGDLSGNPALEALADNGGGTDTLALAPGSKAIDAGADCDDDADTTLAADQRGVSRPQGAQCDIGAYESAPPTGSTGDASNVTYHSATISGDAANPNPFPGQVHFQWGKTTDYGNSTGDDTIPPGTGGGGQPAGVFLTSAFDGSKSPNTTADLDGLEPLTTYHYRLVVTNPDGTSFGADRQFTTTKAPDPDPGPGPQPDPDPDPQPQPEPDPEPQPAATHVAEAEAAKEEADPQPTEIMHPPHGPDGTGDGDGEATRFVHHPSEHSQP
jgi:hypothetical protein